MSGKRFRLYSCYSLYSWLPPPARTTAAVSAARCRPASADSLCVRTLSRPHRRTRVALATAWPCLCLCLASAGGQAPTPPFAGCRPGAPPLSRGAALARQLVADTAVTLTHRSARRDRPVSEAGLQPACVRLYPDGAAALAALETLIDSASRRLDVLMFIWDNDPLGWEVAHRLAARAGPDLPVRVLVDGSGNLIYGQPKDAPAEQVNAVVCWLSHQPYVQVLRTRNPCAVFDHRKLVLADGRAAWSGGRNFTHAAFFGQHDLSLTLEGPLAVELAGAFERFWHQQGGAPGECLPEPEPCPAEATTAWACLVHTEPGDREIAGVLYGHVDRAQVRVVAENPYFSDRRLIARLTAAARRGVDVRVVLTLQSDHDVFNAANRVVANHLLAAGAHVYLYPGMTHVKALAVDGCWAYTGTANFDPLSMRRDRELGLAIEAGPLIEELGDGVLLQDCRPEWELRAPLPLTAHDRAAAVLAGLCL